MMQGGTIYNCSVRPDFLHCPETWQLTVWEELRLHSVKNAKEFKIQWSNINYSSREKSECCVAIEDLLIKTRLEYYVYVFSHEEGAQVKLGFYVWRIRNWK